MSTSGRTAAALPPAVVAEVKSFLIKRAGFWDKLLRTGARGVPSTSRALILRPTVAPAAATAAATATAPLGASVPGGGGGWGWKSRLTAGAGGLYGAGLLGTHGYNAAFGGGGSKDPLNQFSTAQTQYNTLSQPVRQEIRTALSSGDVNRASELQRRLVTGQLDFADLRPAGWRSSKWDATQKANEALYQAMEQRRRASGSPGLQRALLPWFSGPSRTSAAERLGEMAAAQTAMEGKYNEAVFRYGGDPQTLRDQTAKLTALRSQVPVSDQELVDQQLDLLRQKLQSATRGELPQQARDIGHEMEVRGMRPPARYKAPAAPPVVGQYQYPTRPRVDAGREMHYLNQHDYRSDPAFDPNNPYNRIR